MKKDTKAGRSVPGSFKFDLAMKLTMLLLLVSVFTIQANTYSQNAKISLSLEDVSIVTLFEKIEKDTKYRILYDHSEIDPSTKVSVKANNETVKSVLERLFKGTDIGFVLHKKQIVFRKKVAQPVGVKVPVPSIETGTIQQAQISGTITDSEGVPLPGANVLVKGTTIGVVADFDGNYEIDMPYDNGILVFSYIGYKTLEVPISGQSTVNVTLESDSASLDEVVVVGYGSARKRDLTGAVASADLEDIVDFPNPNIMQTLRGAVPGLNIGPTNQAGESPSLNIRGQSTFGGGNTPLIVLDGIIYRGDLSDISPNDIESLDILKDPSSAAIYGSQAANGVILITTKKGRGGKPRFSFSTDFTSQSPSNENIPMNRAQFIQYIKDGRLELSRLGPDLIQENPDFDISPFLSPGVGTDSFNAGADTDWYDLFTGTGNIQTYNLGVRGGTEKTDYYMSLGYLEQDGFVLGDDYSRVNARININTTVNDWFSFGVETYFANADYSGASAPMSQIIRMLPFHAPFDAEGNLVEEPGVINRNPFLELEQRDSDKHLNLFGTLHTDIKLPFLPGFNYRINFSNNYRTENHFNFNDIDGSADNQATGFKEYISFYNWTLDHILSYNTDIGDDHNINLTFLYGQEEYSSEQSRINARDFQDTSLGFNALELGNPDLLRVDTGAWEESSLYTMGRLLYTFKDRYILTGTVRRDGFSGFGSKNKTAVFPSVAVGWVVSEESFLKDASWIDYLKLRGSYGLSGRRALQRYQTLARVDIGERYNFGDGSAPSLGQFISTLANRELKWEITTGLNFGVDYTLFNGRLSGSFDYYNNKTEDILFDIGLPLITGFPFVTENIGEIKNEGLEATLNVTPIQTDKFRWDATLVYSTNRDEIVSIDGADRDGDGIEDDLIQNELFIGEPLNVIYGYQNIGIWQLGDDVPSGFQPGQYRIADLDNSGDFSAAGDRKILGYEDPAYRLGITNKFQYGNLGLSVFINSIQGGADRYYGVPGVPLRFTNTGAYFQLNVPNNLVGQYWTPSNTNAPIRGIGDGSVFDQFPLQQRNFVRLQNVSLSYDFDSDFIESLGLSNLRLYLSGQNLFTWTKWDGLDPETGQGLDGLGTIDPETGTNLDNGGFPVLKTYSVGLNVEF